jgi:hypothetical protein
LKTEDALLALQDHEHDFHCVGFWDWCLASHLATVGFADIYWVQTFGFSMTRAIGASMKPSSA